MISLHYLLAWIIVTQTHCLSNCNCFAFHIANAIVACIYWFMWIFFSLHVAVLFSAFLCLQINVQIPWLPYACYCTRKK